jgi:hypothetical protein
MSEAHMNFIDLIIHGEVSPDDIYRFIQEWHESDSDLPVNEFLGMTLDEYAAWVEDSKSLVNIIANRKSNAP